jgi:hypothetical protein
MHALPVAGSLLQGHPGVTNVYLVAVSDPLAITYNDHSVLENMHAAITFEMMRDPAAVRRVHARRPCPSAALCSTALHAVAGAGYSKCV